MNSHNSVYVFLKLHDIEFIIVRFCYFLDNIFKEKSISKFTWIVMIKIITNITYVKRKRLKLNNQNNLNESYIDVKDSEYQKKKIFSRFHW